MRVFEAPRNFVSNLQRISQVNLTVVCTCTWYMSNINNSCIHCGERSDSHFPLLIPVPQASEDLPLGAMVPSLGLSNKAIFKTSDVDGGSDQTATGGAAKNAFGDNVPVFISVDLDSKCMCINILLKSDILSLSFSLFLSLSLLSLSLSLSFSLFLRATC